MIKKTRASRGLGKYDAPLKVQYNMGYDGFRYNRHVNPFHKDTMQYREWNRGFDKAYFDNMKRVKDNEARTRSRTVPQGEVQHV
tara:strand:+ start:636 stop:887 length:252 start_codon:yes stop_codon:yes gene_type:complete